MKCEDCFLLAFWPSGSSEGKSSGVVWPYPRVTSAQVPRRQAGVGPRVTNSLICMWKMEFRSLKGFLVAVARANFHLSCQPLNVSDCDLAHCSCPPHLVHALSHSTPQPGKWWPGPKWPSGSEFLYSIIRPPCLQSSDRWSLRWLGACHGHSWGQVSPRWLEEQNESLCSCLNSSKPSCGLLLGWLGSPWVLSHTRAL